MESKMIDVFIKRYNYSKDIIMEKRIAMEFIKLHGLSVFKFINRLRKANEAICNKFVESLKEDD